MSETEYDGITGIRHAMEDGMRISLAQYAAIERVAPHVTLWTVLDEQGGVVVATRPDEARTKKWVGDLLRKAGFRPSKVLDQVVHQLQVERVIRRNPKKPQPKYVYDFWQNMHGFDRPHAYLGRIATSEGARQDLRPLNKRHAWRDAYRLHHYKGEWEFSTASAMREGGGWSYTGARPGQRRHITWMGDLRGEPPSPSDLDPGKLRALGMADYLLMVEMYEQMQRRLK